MFSRLHQLSALAVLAALAGFARADSFVLVNGRDAGRYPGAGRNAAPVPGPGFPGMFFDGQRLAGLAGVGPVVTWQGNVNDPPMYNPNHLGSLSFYFRRGSVPIFANNVVPFMGIDFLGGPLLDLDGNLGDPRSLTPTFGQTPVEIPGSDSHIDLAFDLNAGTVSLAAFDATGTNEGGPGLNGGVGTTVNLLADGALNGGSSGPINPTIDTRVGTLTPFLGAGSLAGVYRISGMQCEFWYDSADPASASADELGTLQMFESLRGWLVRRNPATGNFPTLAGQGLGSTLWPAIDTAHVGTVVNTAFDLGFGPTATIADGNASDHYPLGPSHGLALSEYGADLGAYLDAVVVPLLGSQVTEFVYFESAGFAVNNSGDPVFGDTIGTDMVIVAASTAPLAIVGDVNGDGAVNSSDAGALAAAMLNPATLSPAQFGRADVNGDGQLDGRDIQALISVLP